MTNLVETQLWLDTAYPASNRAEQFHIGVLDAAGGWSGRSVPRDAVAMTVHTLEQHSPQGVYLGACTYRPEAGHSRRAVDTAWCYGMWSDLDIDGPGHKHDPAKYGGLTLPADEESARKIVATSGLPEPTVWVHSGGGMYAWWLFDNPAPAADCAELARTWQGTLARAAQTLGWHYGTGVGDLARVLRVPGTVNRKEGLARPATIRSTDGPRYPVDVLAAIAAALNPPAEPNPTPPTGAPRPEARGSRDGDSPLDAFNRSATWVQILQPHGWVHVYTQDGTQYWRHPNATSPKSASTGHSAADTMKCFSDNAGLPTDGTLSKAFVWAALTQGTSDPDMKRAAAELAAAGYGPPHPTGTAGNKGGAANEGDTANSEPVPPPSDPMRVARYLLPVWLHQEILTLHSWRAAWMQWRRTHWAELDAADVRAALYRRLEHAKYWKPKPDGTQELVPWAPTKVKIANLVDALAAITLLPSTVDAPSWSDGRQEGNVVACANGLLRLSDRKLLDHDPRFFNLVSVPFDYDAAAPPPARWLEFLRQTWTDEDGQVDHAAINALQEFFGYVVSGRTDLHKILLIVGPTRSGKGTIARVLTALVGKGNMAGPTLASLATNFGLSPLLGKPLAIVSDARLGGGSSGHQVVERLLTISGEDTIDVDRKYKDPWTGRLPTRFLILSNELPNFGDASGAIAHRFIVLTMQHSWLGRENHTLTDELTSELPGILNWALDGLARLTERGRFTEPASSVDATIAMKDAASPMSAFVRECCDIGAGREVPVDDLYQAWKTWCDDNGRDRPGSKQLFGRNLQSVVPQARRAKPRSPDGKQVPTYLGIALKPEHGGPTAGFGVSVPGVGDWSTDPPHDPASQDSDSPGACCGAEPKTSCDTWMRRRCPAPPSTKPTCRRCGNRLMLMRPGRDLCARCAPSPSAGGPTS